MANNPRQKRRKKAGLPPGSLIFTGQQKVEDPDVNILKYNEKNIIECRPSDLKEAMPEEGHTTWYDVRGLHETKLVEKIGTTFEIHPLILEDILDTHQRPKFEAYKNGFFIIARLLKFDEESKEILGEQLSIYVGQGFILSFQESAEDSLKPVRDRLLTSSGKIRQRNADYLAYAFIDTIVDQYFHILDRIEEQIERLEVDILEGRHDNVKMRIHGQKREVIDLRRLIAPLREAVSQFSKSEHDLVTNVTSVFLRDLSDHIMQVVDLIESHRDALTNLHDLYLSEISFKMNQVMQVLTIIATIFIPLTFLSGIYGMNFDHMPELHWKYSYHVLWGIMGIITMSLLYYFRKKKWL